MNKKVKNYEIRAYFANGATMLMDEFPMPGDESARKLTVTMADLIRENNPNHIIGLELDLGRGNSYLVGVEQ